MGCRLVPDAVVRGLQLAVGLGLAQRGIHNVWYKVAEVLFWTPASLECARSALSGSSLDLVAS